MLGPRTLAPAGFIHTLQDMLTALPQRPRHVKAAQVHAGKYTEEAADHIQQWKMTTNPVLQAAISLQHPPKSPHLVIVVPAPADVARIVIHLLRSNVSFAAFLPSDLAPAILQKDMIKGVSQWNSLGKMVYLATDKVWILGNITETTTLRHVYHLEITAAPLSSHASNVTANDSGDVEIPCTLEE